MAISNNILRYVIDDYRSIRKNLREFIREHKKKNTVEDKIASAKFLKELHRELESHLNSRGILKRKEYRHYGKIKKVS